MPPSGRVAVAIISTVVTTGVPCWLPYRIPGYGTRESVQLVFDPILAYIPAIVGGWVGGWGRGEIVKYPGIHSGFWEPSGSFRDPHMYCSKYAYCSLLSMFSMYWYDLWEPPHQLLGVPGVNRDNLRWQPRCACWFSTTITGSRLHIRGKCYLDICTSNTYLDTFKETRHGFFQLSPLYRHVFYVLSELKNNCHCSQWHSLFINK